MDETYILYTREYIKKNLIDRIEKYKFDAGLLNVNMEMFYI